MRDSNAIMMRGCGFIFLVSISLVSPAQDNGAAGSVYDEYFRKIQAEAAAKQELYAPALKKLGFASAPTVRQNTFETYDPDPTGAHTKTEGERNGSH